MMHISEHILGTKTELHYELDQALRHQIVVIREYILGQVGSASIYLFGSIAKGCYSRTSDIDLLLLVTEDKTTRELRLLRHELEDGIEALKMEFQVDLKVYTESRYYELCQNACFEQAIEKDLINIINW